MNHQQLSEIITPRNYTIIMFLVIILQIINTLWNPNWFSFIGIGFATAT
jgi:hypothetical protein